MDARARHLGGGAGRPAAWLVAGLLVGVAWAPAAWGQGSPAQSETHWMSPGIGEWGHPLNWDNGVPDATMDAYVENGGVAEVTGITGTAAASALSIGMTGAGAVSLNGGALEAGGILIGASGTLYCFQDFAHGGYLGLEAGLVQMQGHNLTLDASDCLINNGMIADAGIVLIGAVGTESLSQVQGSLGALSLRLGGSFGSAGVYDLTEGSVVLDALLDGNMLVGLGGEGLFRQHSGSVGVRNAALGVLGGADGTYVLTDGMLIASAATPVPGEGPLQAEQYGGVWVGVGGGGRFYQDGGDVMADLVGIGVEAGGVGRYEMTDGYLYVGSGLVAGDQPAQEIGEPVPGMLLVGVDGNGTMVQSGGGVSAAVAALAVRSGSVGVYRMTDGRLDLGMGLAAAPMEQPAQEAVWGGLYIGVEGSARFIQEYGEVNDRAVFVAAMPGSVGVYEIVDGSHFILGGDGEGYVYVGFGGDGTYGQGGGLVQCSAFAVGVEAGSVGRAEVSDGVLAVGGAMPMGDAPLQPEIYSDLWVGYAGSGTFSQSGGEVYTNGLYLAQDAGADGTYLHTGGVLEVGQMSLGDGEGLFVYDGGQIIPQWEEGLYLEYGAGAGTVVVEQGTLALNSLELHSAGTNRLVQNGGWVTIRGLVMGYVSWRGGGGGADYEMNGGGLLVCDEVYGEPKDLLVGEESVFTQTEGSVVVCNGSLYVGGWEHNWDEEVGYGEYSMSGGMLNVLRVGYVGYVTALPRGHIYIGGIYAQTEGYFYLSGGEVWASRLYVGPLCTQGGFPAGGEAGTGLDMPLMGFGLLEMSGGLIHLDGDGDAGESESTVGGVISGFGTIISAGPIHVLQDGQIVATGGTLTIDGELRSTGTVVIMPEAALLTHGTLDGSVDNMGVLAAYGGDLRLTGGVLNAEGAVLSNRPGTSLHVDAYELVHLGGIRAYAGGAVTFSQPITNHDGQRIDLYGGAVEAPGIVNEPGGVLAGSGEIFVEAGGLDNYGTTDFSGTTWIYGELVNQPGAELGVRNGDLHVTGLTLNEGHIKILDGMYFFDGGYDGNGTVDVDPAVAVVSGDLKVGPAGVLRLDAPSRLEVRGNFLNASTQEAAFDLSAGTVQLHGRGRQALEAAGADIGASLAGWSANFAIGRLVIEPGAKADLADAFDNALDGAAAEAVYVDTLEIEAYGGIALNGLHLYYLRGGEPATDGIPKQLFYGDFDMDGDVDYLDYVLMKRNAATAEGADWRHCDTDGDGDVDYYDFLAMKASFGAATEVIEPLDGGAAAVPEPATLALLAVGGALLALRRRRQ